MISHANFRWLHLPRTGGSTTAAWLRAALAIHPIQLRIDSCDQPSKHDNLITRFYRNQENQYPTAIAMNFRTLPDWLLSNYKWATQSGLKVPLERYLEGEFFSLRMGRWCPADWWLEYFEVNNVTHLLRTDFLENDWRIFIQNITGIHIPENFRMSRLNQGRVMNEDRFTKERRNWINAYERNPLWKHTEHRTFTRS